MGLFGKKKKEKAAREAEAKKEVSAQQQEEQPKPRVAQKAALTSGRMASLYQSLYQWIFSVNITANVYQIESGEDTFSDGPLPIRGYYDDLLAKLTQEIVPEQQESFSALFSDESIRTAVEGGKSNLTELFCARELGVEEKEEEKRDVKWYEFRVEWLEDVNPNNIVVVFSVRHVRSDLDTGKQEKREARVVRDEEGRIDWKMTRATRLEYAGEGMDFEYDVAEDCMYLHRIPGNSEGDRVTKRYMATLNGRADFEVSHESVSTMKHMLRERTGGMEQSVVLLRKGGVYGAPFHHYRMSAAPIEDDGKAVWIIGRLDDIEEEVLRDERNSEMAKELSNMLKIFRISMFQINTSQGLIFDIEQDESGFRRQEKPQRLAEYIKKRVESGRIAPEAQAEYLKWLENDYLQRKTAQGPYEYEARIKEMGDLDYRWYTETIVAVKGKPGQFVRWRKDDTEGHQAREAENQKKELAHIAEYNGQMLDTLASLVEFRSIESSNHIARVRWLTQILLEDIKKRSPQYEISNREMAMYVQASTMHDIGKITVPDYILNKEGRYTPEEFAIMKKHTTDGAAIIDRLNMPGQEDLKACIRDVVLHHHERYDGNGYPDHLVGDEVKIGVQAVSLADVYDALVSERCYKKGYVSSEALHMILDGQCGAFNPNLIESLKACEVKMREIYENDEELKYMNE